MWTGPKPPPEPRHETLSPPCWPWATQATALAWSNHALASYRAFEGMPEVAQAAPVVAEPLESFLAAQAQPIAALLAQQDAWAQATLRITRRCPPAAL